MARYQKGTLEKIKTARGMVWFIRFRLDGKRPRFEVGLVSQYPTDAKAARAAQHIRDHFNSGHVLEVRTFGDVVAKYELEELPQRHSTGRGYRKWNKLYILPRWGSVPIEEVTAIRVRAWLLKLTTVKGGDMASKSRGHIHGQMRLLFKFAMLWEWLPAAVNPMSLFSIRGATKRAKVPSIVSLEQVQALLRTTPDMRLRAMISICYFMGLSRSELAGMRWGDVNHLNKELTIKRAVVEGRVGPTKNEHRSAILPMHDVVAAALLAWRQHSQLATDEDYVWMGVLGGPLSLGEVQQSMLRPLGYAVGLDFPLGFQTFRHSYRALLARSGADPTVMRDLMRHSNTNTTLNVYGGNVEMDRLRKANERAVSLAFDEED